MLETLNVKEMEEFSVEVCLNCAAAAVLSADLSCYCSNNFNINSFFCWSPLQNHKQAGLQAKYLTPHKIFSLKTKCLTWKLNIVSELKIQLSG